MIISRDVNLAGQFYNCDINNSTAAANCCARVDGAYTAALTSGFLSGHAAATCNVTFNADLSRCLREVDPAATPLGCYIINERKVQNTYNTGIGNATAAQDCCKSSGDGAYVWKSIYDAPDDYRCNDIVNLDKFNACLSKNGLPLSITIDKGQPPSSGARLSSSPVSLNGLLVVALLSSSVIAGLTLNA